MPWLARIYRKREQDQDPNKVRRDHDVDNSQFFCPVLTRFGQFRRKLAPSGCGVGQWERVRDVPDANAVAVHEHSEDVKPV